MSANIMRLFVIRKSFMRFIITGSLATILHFIIALSLINYDITTRDIANGIAFFLTSAVSYFINTLWSFSRRVSKTNAVRYFSVSTVGFMLSCLVAYITGLLIENNFLIILSVALIVPPLIYFLHQQFTYNNRR